MRENELLEKIAKGETEYWEEVSERITGRFSATVSTMPRTRRRQKMQYK